jgi:c-di-GMP-binding flagellar brake protein YcgR
MRPRRILAPRDVADIFSDAVRDNALAVLSIQSGQDWCSFKSRFLERDSNRRFFVLDYVPPETGALPELHTGTYVGVSFRYKSRKILFATVVEARGQFILDDKTSIAAIRYRWPEGMIELQRRAYYRTPLGDGQQLVTTLWPGGVGARQAALSQVGPQVTGVLADLSCGGAMLRLNQAVPLDWCEDDTLGVELQLPDGRPPALVDAFFRGCRHDETGHFGVAVQFVGMEMSHEGQHTLQRIANCVQRMHRMSVATRPRMGTP